MASLQEYAGSNPQNQNPTRRHRSRHRRQDSPPPSQRTPARQRNRRLSRIPEPLVNPSGESPPTRWGLRSGDDPAAGNSGQREWEFNPNHRPKEPRHRPRNRDDLAFPSSAGKLGPDLPGKKPKPVRYEKLRPHNPLSSKLPKSKLWEQPLPNRRPAPDMNTRREAMSSLLRDPISILLSLILAPSFLLFLLDVGYGSNLGYIRAITDGILAFLELIFGSLALIFLWVGLMYIFTDSGWLDLN